MAAIYLVGSGVAGLLAAIAAIWAGGGWFVAVLAYAIVGNLGFTALCLMFGRDEGEPRQATLDREIVADMQAIFDHPPTGQSLNGNERQHSIFPELHSRS